jgi:hypothetical protein
MYGDNDQIEIEMGGTYSMHGGEERFIQGFGGEDPGIDGRIILRLDLQEVGCGGI